MLIMLSLLDNYKSIPLPFYNFDDVITTCVNIKIFYLCLFVKGGSLQWLAHRTSLSSSLILSLGWVSILSSLICSISLLVSLVSLSVFGGKGKEKTEKKKEWEGRKKKRKRRKKVGVRVMPRFSKK
jgi:hypothetical protein